MRQLNISALKLGATLDEALYHSSGEVLLESGHVVTRQVITSLEQAEISQVFKPEPGEDIAKFQHLVRNEVMPVKSLNTGQQADRPIYDRLGALLVEAGTMINSRMGEALTRRGICQIYVRKTPEELNLSQVNNFRLALRGELPIRRAPSAEQIDKSRAIKPEDCTVEKLDALLEAIVASSPVEIEGPPLLESIRRHDLRQGRPQEAKNRLTMMHERNMVGTAAIFRTLGGNGNVEREEVDEIASGVIGGLIEERDLLLNLNNVRGNHDYLASHSLAVTMLAIATAAARGYDRKLITEMAYASYLHDIGMLRLPRQIVERAGRLEPMEITQVRRHPIHSLDMLQTLVGRRSGIPMVVPIVAYQSHERENGSGYPKGRGGKLIHEFAKIVAACDAYQAMTSKRPWREALLPYQAMEQIVLMGARRELDPEVVRAMLSAISLFPIGSWLELSDGSQARVVGLSGSNYARPVVSVMSRAGRRLGAPDRLDLAEHKDVQVVRPVPAPEELVEAMAGF